MEGTCIKIFDGEQRRRRVALLIGKGKRCAGLAIRNSQEGGKANDFQSSHGETTELCRDEGDDDDEGSKVGRGAAGWSGVWIIGVRRRRGRLLDACCR